MAVSVDRITLAALQLIGCTTMNRLLATSLVTNLRRTGRVLAWSALIAITVILALLLQSLAASALVAPVAATPLEACQSTAGAALADGDDVRARFLARLCGSDIAPNLVITGSGSTRH